MVPVKINVGENAKFNLSIVLAYSLPPSDVVQGQPLVFGKYSYRFFLPSGKEIYFERPDGSTYSPSPPPSI
jgi:hypothetical protein